MWTTDRFSVRSPAKPKFSTYQCLRVITDLADGSKLKKEKHKKYLDKQHKKGAVIEVIHDPEWRKKVHNDFLLEVDNRDWLFRISNALLYMGDYSWWGWEYRSKWGQMLASNPQALRMKLWDGEPGKVLLLGEQGLGDEIMFSSCIPDMQAIGAEVEFMCDERLIPVMERSFGIKCMPRKIRQELEVVHEIGHNYDSYFPLGELPRFFRQSVKEFPGTAYLKPDPERVREMEPYRGATGVSWRGRNGYYPMGDFPKGLSLQYDLRWDEEPEEVPHIDQVKDIDGLIALVSVLDKVVCVSTTLAHIAGAVETPVDVVLAPVETRHPENMINWRWRGGQSRTSPWYNSARIYRDMKEWETANKAEKNVREWQKVSVI